MSTERLSPEAVAFLSKMADDIERTMRQTGVVDDAKWQQIARNEVDTLRRIAALLPEIVRDGARWRAVRDRAVIGLTKGQREVELVAILVRDHEMPEPDCEPDWLARLCNDCAVENDDVDDALDASLKWTERLAASLTTPDNG